MIFKKGPFFLLHIARVSLKPVNLNAEYMNSALIAYIWCVAQVTLELPVMESKREELHQLFGKVITHF